MSRQNTRFRCLRWGARVGVVGLLLVGFGSCVNRATMPTQSTFSRKLSGTMYYQSGEQLFISVDVRPARVGGKGAMIPLYLSVAKLTGNQSLYIGRESLVLELPDRQQIPLATYDEFSEVYRRSRADIRISETALETLVGRFPQPPYSYLPLEMFPPRGSSIFPRESVDLKAQQITHGLVYFRLPEDAPEEGRYRLLVSPLRVDATYVVDFPPYKADGKSR